MTYAAMVVLVNLVDVLWRGTSGIIIPRTVRDSHPGYDCQAGGAANLASDEHGNESEASKQGIDIPPKRQNSRSSPEWSTNHNQRRSDGRLSGRLSGRLGLDRVRCRVEPRGGESRYHSLVAMTMMISVLPLIPMGVLSNSPSWVTAKKRQVLTRWLGQTAAQDTEAEPP